MGLTDAHAYAQADTAIRRHTGGLQSCGDPSVAKSLNIYYARRV